VIERAANGHNPTLRNGFRIQIYAGLHPETGKEIRPSRYVIALDNRAGRKADAALAQLIVDHEHQPIAPTAELGTVSDLFDRWLASQAHRLSPKTLAEYRRAARLKILPHLGDMPLNEVRVSDLDRLYVTLLVSGGEDGRALASNSVRRVHIAISGASTSSPSPPTSATTGLGRHLSELLAPDDTL